MENIVKIGQLEWQAEDVVVDGSPYILADAVDFITLQDGWRLPTLQDWVKTQEALGSFNQEVSSALINGEFGATKNPSYLNSLGQYPDNYFTNYWYWDPDKNDFGRVRIKNGMFTIVDGWNVGERYKLRLVRDCMNETIVKVGSVDTLEGSSYNFVEIGNLRWMLDDIQTDGLYTNEFPGYYHHDELENVAPEGWRVPDREDLQDLLKNVPNLDNAREFIMGLLDITYDGFVSMGSPSRLSYPGVFSAHWLKDGDYKKAYTFRNLKLNAGNKNSFMIVPEREFDPGNNPGEGGFMILAKVRCVQDIKDWDMDTLTLLKGWNYVNYPEIKEMPFDQFIESKDLILAKDVNGQPYWPLFGLNMIGNIKPNNFYEINVRNNVKIQL